MARRLLIVGTSDDAARAADAAQRAGIEAVVFDGAAENADEISDAAQTHGAEGIYSAGERDAEKVAAAAQTLGFPCFSPRAARLLRDKEALRAVLARHTNLNPRYGAADSQSETERALNGMGLPAVVKPADGVGGQGASIVEEIDDAPLAFVRASKAAANGRVLIETYLRGQEFRVICHAGGGKWCTLGVFSNVPADNGHLFDRALVAPVRVAGGLRDQLSKAVQRAVRSVGRVHGVVVFEFLLSEAGLCLIELSHINTVPELATRLFPGICGVDLLETDVACFAGVPPASVLRYTSCGALWWIHARSGVVSGVRGEDTARAVPGIGAVGIHAKEGAVLGHQVDVASRDAAGHILALARSPRRALEKARYAAECLHIDTLAALE